MKESLKKAFDLAVKARLKAHAPYSNFKVGACLIHKDGSLVSACNMENASLGGSLCAERNAFSKALSEGYQGLQVGIVIVTDGKKPAPPCGFCLQTMAEFCQPDFEIHLSNLEGIQEKFLFKELLLKPFSSFK